MKRLIMLALLCGTLQASAQIPFTEWTKKYVKTPRFYADSINVNGVWYKVFSVSNWDAAYGWGNWASNFGTHSGKIAQGNDSRINHGETAYNWGSHALAGYKLASDSLLNSGYATNFKVKNNIKKNNRWSLIDTVSTYNSIYGYRAGGEYVQ